MLSGLSPNNFEIRWIPRLDTKGLKNEIGHVTYQSIGSFIKNMKIFTFMCQKGINKASRAQKRFGGQNQYGRVIYPSFGNFTWSKKKYTFGG
jgi:hypothetical protein